MRAARIFGCLLTCTSACSLFTNLDGFTDAGDQACISGGCVDAASDAPGVGDGANADGAAISDGPAITDDVAIADTGGGDVGGESDGPPDAPGTTLAFVQVGIASETKVSVPTTIASTKAGNLLVVGVTQESGTTAVISTITDDAPGGSNVYVSTNQRSIDANCANTAEIWYAKDIHAGASTVTVTMSASVAIEVWVAEFSGLSRTSPFDTGVVASSQPNATVIAAPTVTPSTPNALVVSTATTCGAISGIKSGSPFLVLPIQGGEDTAYYLTNTVGTYGAVWSYSGGTWNGSTVAFK